MCSISVVIPLYNKESSIKDTIVSVINQAYDDFEILVVDDGSTDASAMIVESINDRRIRLIRKKNGGVSSARNLGIKSAIGEYLYFLDADDIIFNHCLQELYSLVLEFPQANIFTANYIQRNENSEEFNYCKRKAKGMVVNPLKEHFCINIYLRTGNTLIHRDCFNRVGFFDEQLVKYEDLEFGVRLMKQCKIAYTPKAVFQYDRKYSQLSKSGVDISKEYASIVDLKEKGFYEKLVLGQYLSLTIQSYFRVEKEYKTAIYLINKNIGEMHYIILSYVLFRSMNLINRINKSFFNSMTKS